MNAAKCRGSTCWLHTFLVGWASEPVRAST